MKIENYAGLEYVTIQVNKKSLPIAAAVEIEKKIAIEIIKSVPIRGKEILFLRKQLGMSLFKFANFFNNAFDPSTLGKWEKRPEERLSNPNETLVRIYFANHYGLKIEADPKKLLPSGEYRQILLRA